MQQQNSKFDRIKNNPSLYLASLYVFDYKNSQVGILRARYFAQKLLEYTVETGIYLELIKASNPIKASELKRLPKNQDIRVFDYENAIVFKLTKNEVSTLRYLLRPIIYGQAQDFSFALPIKALKQYIKFNTKTKQHDPRTITFIHLREGQNIKTSVSFTVNNGMLYVNGYTGPINENAPLMKGFAPQQISILLGNPVLVEDFYQMLDNFSVFEAALSANLISSKQLEVELRKMERTEVKQRNDKSAPQQIQPSTPPNINTNVPQQPSNNDLLLQEFDDIIGE